MIEIYKLTSVKDLKEAKGSVANVLDVMTYEPSMTVIRVSFE